MRNGEAEAQLSRALEAKASGDHAACMVQLMQILRQRSHDAKVLHLLALEYLALDLNERAIAGLETTLRADPKLAAARFDLALLLLASNRFAEARAHFAIVTGASDRQLATYAAGLASLAEGDTVTARAMIARERPLELAEPALTALLDQVLRPLMPLG